MNNAINILRGEHRRNPWIIPGVLVTASAALGSALPDLIGLVHRLWS